MKGAALAVVLLAAIAGAACSTLPASVPPIAEDTLVLTQRPSDGGGEPAARLDLDARYPSGSRVVTVRPQRPGEVNVLSRGLEAAGAPSVSHDGARVLFVGRGASDGRWAVYETAADGSGRRRLFELDRDCSDPAYLAGDHFVVTCADDTAAGKSGGWSLRVVSRRDGNVERITFGAGAAFDPIPLQDGRILFSMRQQTGRGRPDEGVALFTVNPDGSMVEPFYGSHTASASHSRARQTLDGGVVFLATDPAGTTRLQRVEMRRPLATPQTLSLMLDKVDTRAPVYPLSAEPLAGGRLLLTGRPTSGTDPVPTSAVFEATPGSSDLELLFDDPHWDELDAVPLEAGAPPRGKPSGLHDDPSEGTLIVYDMSLSDGIVGPPPDAAKAVSLEVQGLLSGATRSLGRVTLESDGSLYLRVPADRPLRVKSLDERGDEIATSDWFWVRAGETRACFGCHESRDSAPVNRFVHALAADPQALVTAEVRGASH